MTADRPLALLLDFDGTLVPIGATPDAVGVSDRLQALMARAVDRLDGRVAVISGRSLEQLDGLWGKGLWPVTVAASHGLELRRNGRLQAPPPAAIFSRLTRLTEERFGSDRGVVIELKSFGLGLHYRLAPSLREPLRAWAEECAAEHDLLVQPGDMVFELRLPGADKGDAVRAIMRHAPFAGSCPVYVGDDLTDIPAIEAAQALGGRGIAVGERIAGAADEMLGDPAAVIDRLTRMIG